jgi:hypothetical protein
MILTDKRKYYLGFGFLFLLLFFIFVGISIIPSLAYTINVTPISIGDTYIEWNISGAQNISYISLDGLLIKNFDNSSNTFIADQLDSNSLHYIKVVDENYIVGENKTFTTNSNSNKFMEVIMKYLMLFIALILMLLGIRLPIVSTIGIIFSLLNLIVVLKSGDFFLDMMFFCCFVGSTCVTYIGVKR